MTKRFKNIIKDFIHHIDSLDAEDDLPGKGFNGEYMVCIFSIYYCALPL